MARAFISMTALLRQSVETNDGVMKDSNIEYGLWSVHNKLHFTAWMILILTT